MVCRLLDAHQHLGSTPQTFQIVVAAFVGQEQMNDDVAVVHQHPAALPRALDREGEACVAFLHTFADVIHQRFELPVAGTGADDEKVRNDRIRAQVEQDDILGLLVFYQVNDVACQFQRIQKRPPTF